MILEFVFLPLGIVSVHAAQHTPAPTLSLLRQEDGIDGTCSTRKEVKHPYTILVGKCEGRRPRRARIYRRQCNDVMDARKIEC
jgi:hypothetical protein